ncbi:MAG: hypothetical protein GFH27_549279n430 [Chloroflexi bacterium AL-W]|nr:hypothetical protein [Chloroflexi bacterium AL-N1]NOK65396.1 hypothetical protein [Chloroflexi bacterium AL-N10]NOK72338.1 hypothetical protein [Chloroflexi bacterium AL-N5]NOK79575.1 hypothetical protein [Chloroflexi bacterium AL-W]NOK87491.1 hypothetical protein [Chloroflexi bacterium AL-N15]
MTDGHYNQYISSQTAMRMHMMGMAVPAAGVSPG